MLEEKGLTENKALRIDKDFYINTKHSIEDYFKYCSYFGYTPTIIKVGREN